MPGSKSRTAAWWAWTQEIDKALLDAAPIHRPENCISDDDVHHPAPWYSWDASQWKFKCLLCDAWVDNDAHIQSGNHIRKRGQVDAQKWVNFKLKRVVVNSEYDYYDAWGLQKQLGIGKFAGNAPAGGAMGSESAGSNGGTLVPWGMGAPPGLAIPRSEPSDNSDLVDEVRRLMDEVRLLRGEVRELKNEVRNSVLGDLREASGRSGS